MILGLRLFLLVLIFFLRVYYFVRIYDDLFFCDRFELYLFLENVYNVNFLKWLVMDFLFILLKMFV